MKQRTKIIGALIGLAALTGAECGEDPRAGGKDGGFHEPAKKPKIDRPGCPDIDFRADDERCLIIQTFVSSRNGPYDVNLNIEGGNGAYPPHVPIAAGGWTHSLVYRTGVKMTLTVTIHYEGREDKEGYCSITDNLNHAKDSLRSIRAQGGSPYQAICTLTTSQ